MAGSAEDTGARYNEQISKTKIWQVIGASAVGTMIEWYDFYIFGSLAGDHRAALLPAGKPHVCLHRLSRDVCRRVCRSPVRRACSLDASAILSAGNMRFS